MFNHTKAFVFAAAALALLPATVNAATITTDYTIKAGEFFSKGAEMNPGDTVEYKFAVLEDLSIESFSVSATGNNDTNDLTKIRFGFSIPAMNAYSDIRADGGPAAAAFGFLPGATYQAGEFFSVYFEDGIQNAVSLTLSFKSEVSAIPLPAGVFLLAPFLLAGGVIGARRRKAGAAKAV